MKPLIALLLLTLTAAPLAAEQPTEEEVKQLTADTLEHTDTDADGVITLAEQQDRLKEFYVAFAKAGNKSEKQPTVREEYPHLLTLHQYLAADLNDDKVVEDEELKRLFRCADPLELWTLSDEDIDLLVEDFILRIRKGAKPYPDDSLRKIPGKGKNKTEKLVDQASPYRAAVNRRVFAARVHAAIYAEYTPKQLSSMFDKEGRAWETGIYHSGSYGSGSGFGVKVVAKDKANAVASAIEGAREEYPEGYQLPVEVELKGYGEKPHVTKVKLKVVAGTFDCDYIEIKSLGMTTKIWLMSKHPGITVKQVTTIDGKDRVAELISYQD